jgi:hypothetical protein
MAPQQQKQPSVIPTGASSWDEKTLDLLNAKFEEGDVTPFNIVKPSNIDENLQLPEGLQTCI